MASVTTGCSTLMWSCSFTHAATLNESAPVWAVSERILVAHRTVAAAEPLGTKGVMMSSGGGLLGDAPPTSAWPKN